MPASTCCFPPFINMNDTEEVLMKLRMLTAMVMGAALLAPSTGHGQMMPRKDQPDTGVDARASRAVVEGILKELKAAYVFPETAAKLEADLRKRLEKDEYDEIKSAKKLADVLTEHLQAISKDKHLRVFYSYDPIPEPPKRQEAKPEREKTDERLERMREHARSINYGFEKAERLEGNVGYLDLRGFYPAEMAGETAVSAMNLLANTDALIIDVRKNGGGAPSGVALVCSYLFGSEPVHLNDLYFRPEDSTQQWWTYPHLPGKRYEGKPVYVLTSRRTFSAAEEFTYNLKCLKRATIVGETTGGGAHPGGMRRIHEHFGVFVPSGRAINPITKTNWEGTGVTPDIPAPADRALPTAHLDALRKIAADLEGPRKEPKRDDPMRVREIKAAIERLEKQIGSKDNGKKSEAARARPAKG
jgi:hypothetical protein